MFEVITQSQPHDYQSLEILKEAYFKLGRQKDVVNTSKQIAQAYVQLGQLSSAILEYETILQRYPDDPDVLGALSEIESKANSLNTLPALDAEASPKAAAGKGRARAGGKGADGIDDGQQAMHKIFVEGKIISSADFDSCWPVQNSSEDAGSIAEPFIQILADRELVPLDQSLRLLCDKSRFGYLLLERYDIDMELARTFAREVCQRWCVVPFDRMSKSVLVATANPFNKQATRELESAAHSRLLWYVAPPADLVKVLRKVFR
jgi:tetratricopeptide (TPR) repeat protein